MNILHTSDWHLGHRFHEQSQWEEQTAFLSWLLDTIRLHSIDLLLVAGDVFDVGVPPAQAQKMYYDFLLELYRSNCHEVIIIGGNHDAPSTLNAPGELLKALSVRVVGKATDKLDDEIFRVSVRNETVIIAAVPYLRDQDIRRAIASETAEEINNRYKTALIGHFDEVAARCVPLQNDTTPVLAMGHLFAVGGKTSDSEQSIYVGNLGDIGAEDFPAIFDYVALGHLHRAQKVGNRDHIRYSGTPYPLSFSEINQDKKVIMLQTGDGLHIREITVPAFRKIIRLTGTVQHCKDALYKLEQESNPLTTWVEVVLTDPSEATTGYKEIQDFAAEMQTEVLKITVQNDYKYDTLLSQATMANQQKPLTPSEVFRMKCAEMQIDPDENQELLDAFNEIVQLVQTQE